jgi:hypothetical protein
VPTSASSRCLCLAGSDRRAASPCSRSTLSAPSYAKAPDDVRSKVLDRPPSKTVRPEGRDVFRRSVQTVRLRRYRSELADRRNSHTIIHPAAATNCAHGMQRKLPRLGSMPMAGLEMSKWFDSSVASEPKVLPPGAKVQFCNPTTYANTGFSRQQISSLLPSGSSKKKA